MVSKDQDLVARYAHKSKLRRRRKIVFRIFLFLCLFFLISYWGSRISTFNITDITVSGNISAPVEDIIASSDLEIGVNGLSILYKNPLGIPVLRMMSVEKKIAGKLPFVEEAVVRYLVPDKVTIQIREKVPVFIFDSSGSRFFMDKETSIIGPATKRPDIVLPVIYGIDATGKVDGDSLLPENALLFDSLETLISSIKSIDSGMNWDLFSRIISYEMTNLYSIKFKLDSGLSVNIGDIRNIDNKLRFLKVSFDAGTGLSGAKNGEFLISDDGKGKITGNLHQ